LEKRLAAARKTIAGLRAALTESRKALVELQEQGKELRLSEEKFRLMFENCDDAVIHVDRSGTIIDANRRIEDGCWRDGDG